MRETMICLKGMRYKDGITGSRTKPTAEAQHDIPAHNSRDHTLSKMVCDTKMERQARGEDQQRRGIIFMHIMR